MSGAPREAPFRYSIPVRYADTDAQGHVFFANYLTYLDEAWSALLRELGFTLSRLAELEADLVYAESRCQHRGSARYEDTLEVEARVSHVGTTSVQTQYRVLRRGELLATGQLVSVCIHPLTRSKRPLPEALRRALIAAGEP